MINVQYVGCMRAFIDDVCMCGFMWFRDATGSIRVRLRTQMPGVEDRSRPEKSLRSVADRAYSSQC